MKKSAKTKKGALVKEVGDEYSVVKRPKRTDRGGGMLPEYDFSTGIRGKYVARFAAGTNLVALDPKLIKLFPDSASVNRALRGLATRADKH